MTKKISFSFVLLLSSSKVLPGIGAIDGGANKHWTPVLNKTNLYIDWPVVRYSEDKVYKIHELCLHDDNTLATRKKVIRFKWVFDEELFQTTGEIKLVKVYSERSHRKMLRVYDQKNCRFSGYANCELVGKYIKDSIDVPIWKNNRSNDDFNLIPFLRTAKLKEYKTYYIPQCFRD